MDNALLVALAFFLVLLNGFFVAAEFAIVKLRDTRVDAIRRTKGLRGEVLARVHGSLDAYLSACQLGITLSSLGLGWVGEPAFARLLEPLFAAAGIESPEVIHGVSFVVAFSIISYLHIVVGELAPKSMALRQSESVSLWTALPLFAFYWLMYPFIWFLNHSAFWLLRRLGLASRDQEGAGYSPEELRLIMRASRPTGNLTAEEWSTLSYAMEFGELEVSDVMRPISDLTYLRLDEPWPDCLAKLRQHRFSRYPVQASSGQDFAGLLHIKDLMGLDGPPESLQPLLRPLAQVDQNTPAVEVFRQFRDGSTQFAIVYGETGTPIGFVTFDNLLAALIGNVADEFRPGMEDWVTLDDGTLIGKGTFPLFGLERVLGIDIDDEVDASTISGLITWKLERLPTEGERIHFEEFDVLVQKMEGPRVRLVRIYPHNRELTPVPQVSDE